MNELDSLVASAQALFAQSNTPADLENAKAQFLGKSGRITALMKGLVALSVEEKKSQGAVINVAKQAIEAALQARRQALADAELDIQLKAEALDVTLPGRTRAQGGLHPVSITLERIESIFGSMGFEVAEGPDVEDDAHNFGKLNFAANHPARDMQDTFFVDNSEREDVLLRTHTSSVQVRVMESMKPPIRCIMPGRVYRNEAVSARSLAEFHQIEGLYIAKGVSMADLKGTIMEFARQFYDAHAEFRFRTSYFPFTEPSCEIDMSCFLCKGGGCRICKHSGWLEICGAGMVHPNVLRACGIDPEEYSGFAFGFGVERVVLMMTGVDDIRMLYDNDLRVLGQFQ